MRRFVEPNVAGIPIGPLPKPVYPCGICSKNVGNKKSLNCDICGFWSHIGCEGISAYNYSKMIKLSDTISCEVTIPIIDSVLADKDPNRLMQFFLDCFCMPDVILVRQEFGLGPLRTLFYLSRTWCYSMHRGRMTKLGLFQYR